MNAPDQRRLRQCLGLLIFNVLITAGSLAGSALLVGHTDASGSSYERQTPQMPEWPANTQDGPLA